jgi:hypothetical protein
MPPLEALKILADFGAKHAEHIYVKRHTTTKRIEVLRSANLVYQYIERKEKLQANKE